jgi:leucyl aminopeptidase
LKAAAEGAGERLWRMPLFPEDVETMKGTHADLKNAGPRWGSANTAASFLGQFVGDVRRWAHVDIAGPAYVRSEGKGNHGATGFGVPFLVNWLSAR